MTTTGMSSTLGLVAGMQISGTFGISAGTLIASVNSATQITLTQSATASGAPTLTASANSDNFVLKLDPTGSTLLWSTVLVPDRIPSNERCGTKGRSGQIAFFPTRPHLGRSMETTDERRPFRCST